MIFTVNIGGTDVTMNNSLEWMFNYKRQFKEDPMKFLMEALKKYSKNEVKEGDPRAEMREQEMTFDVLAELGLRIPGMAWAMARTVDKNLPAPNVWEAQFSEFPLVTVGAELLTYAVNGLTGNNEAPKNE